MTGAEWSLLISGIAIGLNLAVFAEIAFGQADLRRQQRRLHAAHRRSEATASWRAALTTARGSR